MGNPPSISPYKIKYKLFQRQTELKKCENYQTEFECFSIIKLMLFLYYFMLAD